MEKTAGIIIIGDEILTSKVQDNNSFFMRRSCGLMEYNYAAPMISDSVNEIAEEVRTFCERFNFVP